MAAQRRFELLTKAQRFVSAAAGRAGFSLIFLAWVIVGVVTMPAHAQRSKQSAERTTSVHWDKVPLRDALSRLTLSLGDAVPMFIDRRVDPSQRISLDVTDATADEVLSQTAAAASLGTSRLGRLVYFGPPAVAAQLRTLAEIGEGEFARLPPERRASSKQSLTWPRLAEPRQLVTKAVEDRGLRIVNAEKIPHDLWPAGSLPALSLPEQLAVLLVGFDLTFVVDGPQSAVKLVPIAGQVTITRHYRKPSAAVIEQLQAEFPDLETQLRGNELTVVGTAEEHERVGKILRPQQGAKATPPIPANMRKVYTLRIEQQPIRNVLEQLGQRLGWTIEIDDAARKSLDERVTFSVENVDEEELLRALLRPAGLMHERDGNRVRVAPLKPNR